MPSRICSTLANLLDPETCLRWVERLEALGFDPTGGDYPASYRDNDRLILVDADLAADLLAQMRAHLPPVLERDGQRWTLQGLNPRFRSCRYRRGQAFTRHRDGAHSEDARCRSLLTLMLYLNDGSEFEGGGTRFYADRWSEEVALRVEPLAGTGVVFDHALWHDGEAVTSGTKYVLRTDVMYACEEPCEGHTGYVFDLVELSDGRLASGSRDKTIRVWSSAGRMDAVLRHHTASVTCLCVAGERLWSGGRDREIAIWSSGLELHHHFRSHDGAVLALLPLEDGGVASSGADGRLRFWTAEGALERDMACGSWPWALHRTGSEEVLVGDDSGDIVGYRKDGVSTPRFRAPSGVQCLLLCGEMILAGGSDGRIYRWRVSGEPLAPWRGHRGPVTSLVLLPDGSVLSGSEDDGVRVWSADGESREVLRHGDFVRALCLVEGGARLASGSYDGSVRVTALVSS